MNVRETISPPRQEGSWILRLADTVGSPKSQNVLAQIVGDMRTEIGDALDAERPVKASFACARGYYACAKAAGLIAILKWYGVGELFKRLPWF